MESNILKE